MYTVYNKDQIIHNDDLLHRICSFAHKAYYPEAKDNRRLSDIVQRIKYTMLKMSYIITSEESNRRISKLASLVINDCSLHRQGIGLVVTYFIQKEQKYNYKETKTLFKLILDIAKKNNCSWILMSKRINKNTYKSYYKNVKA